MDKSCWQQSKLVSQLIWMIFVALIIAGCIPAESSSSESVQVSPSAQPSPTPELMIDAGVLETAVSFRNIRPLQGQFDGVAWNDDVDQWNGTKHTMMIELGIYLGDGTFDRSHITDLLGTPDQTVRADDELYTTLQAIPTLPSQTDETAEFIVYNWRGTHDFLFFIVQENKVIGSDWWYAGE